MSWGVSKWGSSKWGLSDTASSKGLSEVRSLIAAYTVTAPHKERFGSYHDIGPTKPLGSYSKGLPTEAKTTVHSSTTSVFSTYTAGTLDGGFSLILGLRNFSKTPDIRATITSFQLADISALINAIRFVHIAASIRPLRTAVLDMLATVGGFGIYNFPTSVFSVVPEDISVSISPIYSYISATIGSIEYSRILATIGAHLPVDIAASIFITQPYNFSAFIHGFLYGDPVSLGASIAQVGGYSNLSSYVSVTSRMTSNLRSIIRVKEPVDISGKLYGWEVLDISASISRVYQAPDFRAIIRGTGANVYSNLHAIIRRADSSTLNLGTLIRPRVSTHTSDKAINVGRFPKAYPDNRYVSAVGFSGFSIIAIEPIFGNFPDLHATINVINYYRSSISAIIRPLYPTSTDFSVGIKGTAPYIHIDRVRLDFVLFRSIGATITPTGEHTKLRVSIKPIVSTSTGTSFNAGYSYSYSTTQQFFATNMGVVVLPKVSSSIKRGTYVNVHLTPDLNAFVAGWAESNLSTYINVFPMSHLSASVYAWDSSHMSQLLARLQPVRIEDFSALINVSGGISPLSAVIQSRMYASSMQVTINGYIEILSRDIINVHTKPFSDFRASINFNNTFSCSFSSQVKDLETRIRGIDFGYLDISASILSLHEYGNIGASISGFKRIRPKILTLYFRARSRESEGIRSTILGLKPELNDLSVSIIGLSHIADLPTSITVTRIKPKDVDSATSITIVDIDNPENKKEAEVVFYTGVDKYVYDSDQNSLYADGGLPWSLLVREVSLSDSFFDADSGSRYKIVSSMSGFDSVDEAVRDGINMVGGFIFESFGATINSIGYISSMQATVYGDSVDRTIYLPAKIFPVYDVPDISATITGV